MFKKIFFVHKKRKYQFGSQNVLTPNIKKRQGVLSDMIVLLVLFL